MLVLSRKEGERLVIGDNITITINKISGNRVTVGIDAPRDVRIVRGELTAFEDEVEVEVEVEVEEVAASTGGPAAMPAMDIGFQPRGSVAVFGKAEE